MTMCDTHDLPTIPLHTPKILNGIAFTMVKRKVGGAQRFVKSRKAVAALDQTQPQKPSLSGKPPPKHVQRKVARKVGFLDRVAASKAEAAASVAAARLALRVSKKGSGVVKKQLKSKAESRKTSALLFAGLGSALGSALDEALGGAPGRGGTRNVAGTPSREGEADHGGSGRQGALAGKRAGHKRFGEAVGLC
jgi:hypothetical protein